MSNDPALKYIPGAKAETEAKNISGSHGFFTNVSYLTAWVIVCIGSLGAILTGLSYMDMRQEELGLVIMVTGIVGSVAAASVIGMLAEISRKLSVAGS